jgi:hypothetical protein
VEGIIAAGVPAPASAPASGWLEEANGLLLVLSRGNQAIQAARRRLIGRDAVTMVNGLLAIFDAVDADMVAILDTVGGWPAQAAESASAFEWSARQVRSEIAAAASQLRAMAADLRRTRVDDVGDEWKRGSAE